MWEIHVMLFVASFALGISVIVKCRQRKHGEILAAVSKKLEKHHKHHNSLGFYNTGLEPEEE
jgi:L-amino acid N-acyltransferase YncA